MAEIAIPRIGIKIRYEDIPKLFQIWDRIPFVQFGFKFANFDRYPNRTIRFRPVDWELLRTIIRPRHAPHGKEVLVLRVHIAPEYCVYPPCYIDFAESTLIWQLLPILTRPDYSRFEIEIQQVAPPPLPAFIVKTRPIR